MNVKKSHGRGIKNSSHTWMTLRARGPHRLVLSGKKYIRRLRGKGLSLCWLTDKPQHFSPLAKLTGLLYVLGFCKKLSLWTPWNSHLKCSSKLLAKASALTPIITAFMALTCLVVPIYLSFLLERSILKVRVMFHLLLYPQCLTEYLAHKELQYDFQNVDNERENLYNVHMNQK